jgi:DNA-binding MarR family transcriptional regulator
MNDMDYEDLANEFLRNMQSVQKAGSQRFIQEGVQGEAIVLHHIRKHGEMIPGHISDAMGISSARVATVLNGLEAKGLITREIDSGDRRRIIVRLTSNGSEYAEEQRKRHVGMIRDILMQLGEHDAKEYVRITGRLAEVLSNLRP